MITASNCFKHILKLEPNFNLAYKQHLVEWENKSNIHAEMSAFADYIEVLLINGEHANLKIIFNYIEHLLEPGIANEEVQEAICTCFLENLINCFCQNETILSLFVPLLGKESREYCKAWDEFTGCKTPGLWD